MNHYTSLKICVFLQEITVKMDVIRYINCCIVEFGRRLGLEPKWACRYLYLHGGLELLDKNYQAEHLLPLDDTIDDLISYCKRHGGTLE